ncbi:MAG: hypothetical protein J1E62_10830 [Lachnospiraceae bacterium]|nr:hypothetical protein [Lachnospiraceae bacterium]
MEQTTNKDTVEQTAIVSPSKKKGTAILLSCGMFALGLAFGIGGTLLVQKKPWVGKEDGNALPKRSFDVDKCVTLGEYDGIKVSLAASQEDIQSEIDTLIEDNTTYVKKKGTVTETDMVYAKFDGYIDNKIAEDTCGEDYVDIASDDFVEGFATAFVGAKTGKEFSFKVTIPEGTYGDDTIDGKEVTFKATVKYICGDSIVPEWDDTFVQSISDFKTTKEYEAQIKEEIEAENQDSKEDFAWTDVLEGSKVNEYPEELMEEAKKEVLQGYYDMADMYGMSHDEIFQAWGRENEADFVRQDLNELAKDTVKEILVTEAIAKAEGINYSDEEYKEMLDEEYEYNTDTYDSKKEYEKENKAYLQRMVLMTKVQEWIAEHAEFEE